MTLPCPWWCALPPGHGFDSVDPQGWLVRGHEYRYDVPGSPVGATLGADEYALPANGHVVPLLDVPFVLVSADYTQLTGPQARQLAMCLWRAADAWDAVVRGGR
jgi:hypothetical protein